MENTVNTVSKPPFWKHIIQWSLILAGIMIAIDLIFYVVGVEYKHPVRYSSFLVMAFVLYYAAVKYRDNYKDGIMSYGQGYGLMLLIAVFSSFVTSIYTGLFLTYFDSTIIEKILAETEQKMLENPQMTEETIEAAMKVTEKFMNPLFFSISGFLSGAFLSAILCLIVAIFPRKGDLSTIQ